MSPSDYRRLSELIRLYGSAQFWRGANNMHDAIYENLTKDSENYYKDILVFFGGIVNVYY